MSCLSHRDIRDILHKTVRIGEPEREKPGSEPIAIVVGGSDAASRATGIGESEGRTDARRAGAPDVRRRWNRRNGARPRDARDRRTSVLGIMMERAKGIEPSYEAWEASVLPLNYARSALLTHWQERRIRTPNPRFWRPVLCQLSYTPNQRSFCRIARADASAGRGQSRGKKSRLMRICDSGICSSPPRPARLDSSPCTRTTIS